MADGQITETEIDDEILKQVIDLAKGEDDSDLSPSFINHLTQLVRYATGEDRIWDDPSSLLRRATSAWEKAKVRPVGEAAVSLEVEEGKNWSEKRLVLDIATDDKPFLVDSLSTALSEAGKHVSFFSNAVVDVPRDAKGVRIDDDKAATIRESMIHAEMDPPVAEGEIEELRTQIEDVLHEVSMAVSDWEPMRARLAERIAQLERLRIPGLKNEDQKEVVEFLKWLWDNHFAFLGVRRFNYSETDGGVLLEQDADKNLGILQDTARRILKSTFKDDGQISPAVEAFLKSDEPVLVAKATTKSLVHRRVYMDYVAIKTYAPNGEVDGEELFIGLFTADAYNRPATDIPLVRAKVNAVLNETEFTPGGHNEKALSNILETYPRDELFQIDAEELRESSLSILRLYKRPRVKMIFRRDRFERFVSALVFIPRDRFNSSVREEIGELLAETFHGKMTVFSPSFGDAALVRVHFIISIAAGAPDGPGVTELTRKIRKICRNWSDDLLDVMRSANDGAIPANLFEKFHHAFGEGYKERGVTSDTLKDIVSLEALADEALTLRAYRNSDDNNSMVRIKLYRRGGPLPLSRLIPTIENLGLNVVRENGHEVCPFGGSSDERMWIHDFCTEHHGGRDIDLEKVKHTFEETIYAVLNGEAEDDGFNALVLTSGISWREAWLLRAAAKHHQQANFAYSIAYMQEALANNPDIAADLMGVFHARFNPAGAKKADQREADVDTAKEVLLAKLEDVRSLTEDRIIRRFLDLFSAITRTNFYQLNEDGKHKPCISFKIESAKLAELPEPKPYREIFVSSPRVDGVHLRFGPIARGGLRWSDRREDFRTEVLGLVKAQRVKNAVIVPSGAKGCFYPNQLPDTDDRAAIYEEGRAAYQVFIRGMLDLTDNISRGKVTHPSNMVIWDEPDPYLVVAADKGTAQFSDTANAISEEYGFWLGDAFASGGSVGYDHKVMGITARGAWEAVKRHFREIGKDIQKQVFTVAGVGDMSGDVFGNGMLLSKKIKLVAAFDHRDIFLDPTPDAAKSYAERQRLFDLPRSSWNDYDKDLISKGGGVFSRSAKSIKLSVEIRKALNISDTELTPNELIKAILKAPMELFWLGGIGTYFKGSSEEHVRVGDRANDAIRIDAKDAGAQVIGEGANLGLTQLGRIEFAKAGGRINTDAIDNSAGVDSSDHEVNIKILLSAAIEQAELLPEERNDLLASMTDDVAAHVLVHNYEQTRALSQIELVACAELDNHARFMSALEREGRLDRAIEFLPNSEEIIDLRAQQKGLTRPELSVLLAYAKLKLFDELVESSAPDDPAFESELIAYFPEASRKFVQPIAKHRLRREIIATRLSNEIVDSCGISFVQRAVETTGVDVGVVALAYEAARRIYSLGGVAEKLNELDNEAPAKVQIQMYQAIGELLAEQVFHLLSDQRKVDALATSGIGATVSRYETAVGQFKTALPAILPADAAEALQYRQNDWVEAGLPENLAREGAMLPVLEFALDIVDLAGENGWSNPAAGSIYFAVGQRFHIDAVRERARHEPPVDHFDKVAIRQQVEDLSNRQKQLADAVIGFAKVEPKDPDADKVRSILAEWEKSKGESIDRFFHSIGELDFAGPVSVGKLALILRRLDELIDASA